MTSLKRLDLSDCSRFTRLAVLTSLTGLEELYIGGCIAHPAPLSGLAGLSLAFCASQGIPLNAELWQSPFAGASNEQ